MTLLFILLTSCLKNWFSSTVVTTNTCVKLFKLDNPVVCCNGVQDRAGNGDKQFGDAVIAGHCGTWAHLTVANHS